MPLKEFLCPICEGNKTIEVGTELNDKKLEDKECPACSGIGYVTIEYHIHTFAEKWWKRLSGEL